MIDALHINDDGSLTHGRIEKVPESDVWTDHMGFILRDTGRATQLYGWWGLAHCTARILADQYGRDRYYIV